MRNAPVTQYWKLVHVQVYGYISGKATYSEYLDDARSSDIRDEIMIIYILKSRVWVGAGRMTVI